MCWEMDYYWFAEQQKAQEIQKEKQKEQKLAQRAEAIDKLLSEANKQADKPDATLPAKETLPAK